MVTEKKTALAIDSTTESANTEPILTEAEAQCRDMQTALSLYIAAQKTLADEAAFDSIAPIAGQGGISLEPVGDPKGLDYNYYVPEGADVDIFLDKLDENIANETIPLYYYNMEFKPTRWGIFVDKDFNVYIHAVTDDGQAVELYPNTDSWYQYASVSTKKNKANDVVTAAKISTAVSAALADENGYFEVYEYAGSDDLFIASAKPGEPFRSTVNKSLNSFLGIVNEQLGGKAPVLYHLGISDGWVPKEWEISLSDKSPYLKVFISDGTDVNRVEVYPDIDKTYD